MANPILVTGAAGRVGGIGRTANTPRPPPTKSWATAPSASSVAPSVAPFVNLGYGRIGDLRWFLNSRTAPPRRLLGG